MKAKKSLGQNFLMHRGTLNKILRTANISSKEHVLEIGPGHGVLTEKLLENAKKVTAIELDDRLIPELTEKFTNHKNFTLLHQDALTFTPPKTPYKLVANIPYYITSPIINHFLREQPASNRPKQMTLLVQKEVAKKITTGNNVLALQVLPFGTPKLIAKVPPSHFKPAPKVDSAILQITMHAEPLIPDADLPKFFELIHAGFAHKRKKLIRNLEKIILPKSFPFPENTRAEELTLENWKTLYSLPRVNATTNA